MEHMTVRMNEWFFTQALVGYKKILETYGETVQTTHDGIIIEKRHLEMMDDAFFSYYLEQYSVASREERALQRMHRQFKDGDVSIKNELNKRLKDTADKVKNYFKNTTDGSKLIEVGDLYRKEKEYIDEMDEWLREFIDKLKTEAIDQRLTANFFKAVHLGPYFGQVSMLNVSHNKKSIDEQKSIFYKDLVAPVIEEWTLWEALDTGCKEKIFEILNATSHKPFNQLKRAFRKLSVEEMKSYVQQEVHKCSLTGFPIALLSFEEKIFSPLALSLENKEKKNVNMTWDVQGRYFPLCSLARLLIFCAQAGATMSQGKSVFIFYGGAFDEIYQTNQFYADMKSPDKTFDEIVFDLVREQKVKADYLRNHYMIFEYESDYKAKKTLLNYMVMTPPVMKLFAEHANLFNHIHYSNKTVLIRSLLKGYDPKQHIVDVLRVKVKNAYSPLEVIRMTQIRHLYQLFSKEVANVDNSKEKRYVWALVKSAEEVKHLLGESKAQGIAYRLLNAVRSNNKQTFMDTVMRTYISCDLQMPGLLLEALHEEKMDFATVGNAWIAGLVSKSSDMKKEDTANG